MGQERERVAGGTIEIMGGVCRVGSWVLRGERSEPGRGSGRGPDFPRGGRQGEVCPAASTGGFSERLGPGSLGTGPFRRGFSDSEGCEGLGTGSRTALRAALDHVFRLLMRCRGPDIPQQPASTRLRPVLLALPGRLPGRAACLAS